ncbi:hypothetical protein [Parapedobacter luteus]|uniref:hypothetical protein n=1 Tax=Parapedobacter luteus TaxID=623280 RepID=UPI001116C4C2|nr:hypothetical protein [Parapedobacter luteus]
MARNDANVAGCRFWRETTFLPGRCGQPARAGLPGILRRSVRDPTSPYPTPVCHPGDIPAIPHPAPAKTPKDGTTTGNRRQRVGRDACRETAGIGKGETAKIAIENRKPGLTVGVNAGIMP